MPMNLVIQERRKALRLTQEQVAQYLNVSIPAVSKWETGVTSPDLSLLAPLARPLLKLGRHKLYFEFSIGFEEAKRYRNANGQILRRSQWQDLTCQVYI